MLSENSEFKVALGVIWPDCHATGSKALTNGLGQQGIKVENLGAIISQDEFIESAKASGADAVLVFSIYGHGEIHCQNFRARCEEKGLGDIVLYVGGNIGLGKGDFSSVEEHFKEMGFDRVFPTRTKLEQIARLLKDDIRSKRQTAMNHNTGLAWAPSAVYAMYQ